MAQISSRSPLASRRAGLPLVAVAIVLAIGAFFLGNTYLTAEAAKVNAPVRTVYAASRDIAAGTLLRAEDLATTSMALPDQLAGFFLVQTPGAPPPAGVAAIDLKMGQPVLGGDLLSSDSAQSVAPLVPLKVRVGADEQDAVGALNLPLDRLVAPPPKVRVHDRIDLWASSVEADVPSLQLVMENVEIIAFSGAGDAPEGYVIAVTVEHLDRYLFFSNTGSPLVVTVRSSRAAQP